MSSPSSSSPLARWLLPALAVIVVLGVLALGSGWEKPRPPARLAGPPADPSAPGVSAPVLPPPAPARPVPPAGPIAQAPPSPGPAPREIIGPAAGPVAPVPAAAAAAATVLPLIDPLPLEPPFSPGEPATARVTVGGQSTPLLSPNQIGAFPRVYLPLGGQADVQVQLPQAEPGDQVVAAVTDGGRFADGQPVQAFTLDESRQIAFRFQASQSLGNFRVNVRHGAQTKTVTFWAGDRARAVNR